MSIKRIRLLLTVVAACISLTFSMTPAYGASVVIGGNYTDIGTIIFVSPKPGDTPATAGTGLLNTINGITDNSEANPYLIKVGPGIYDIGASSLQMKPFVDIEGSGEKTTKITGAVTNNGWPPNDGTIKGASNAELRFLTVEDTGVGIYTAALLNLSAFPSILHVTANASGGTGNNYGVYNNSSSPVMTNVTANASGGANNYGVYNNSFSPVMTNVTANASGGTGYNIGVRNDSSSPVMTNVTANASGGTNSFGFYNDSSSPVMTNVTANASGAINNYGVANYSSGTVKINHSVIKGSTVTIVNTPGVTTRVGNTQLDGGAVSNSGTLTCVGAYDENYVALLANCL